MFIRMISVFILLIGSITMSHAKQNTMYYMQINAHLMYCEARINGMYLFNTLQQTSYIPELLTMGQPISEYMDQGKNNITLEVENVSQDLTAEEMATGYCELTTTEQTFSAETHEKEARKVLSNIRVTYKKKDENSPEPEYVLVVVVESQKINNGLTNGIVLLGSTPETDTGYATKTYGQEISVAEAYPFRWIHESTPIVDNRENREEVWNAYMAIKQAILNKDKAAIKKKWRL